LWVIAAVDINEQPDISQENTGVDTNEASNELWNGGFGGGNTNMDEPANDGLINNDFGDGLGGDPIAADEFQQEKVVNKPKVGHAFEAPLSEEEELRIQQIENEQQEKQRSIQMKEEEEYADKKDAQSKAREELDKWYSQKNSEKEAKSKQNKEEEWAYLQTRDEHKNSKNPWEKILDNVEINPTKYIGTKDVSRMRQSMLARKGDLKDGKI